MTLFFYIFRKRHFFGIFSNLLKKKWGKVNYIFFLQDDIPYWTYGDEETKGYHQEKAISQDISR